MLDSRQGRAIITAIHRAALDPAAWQEVVDKLELAVPGSVVVLNSVDKAMGHSTVTGVGSYDPDFVRKYFEYFAPLNPWPARYLVMPTGQARIMPMDIDPDFSSTEFYNDWVRPQGDMTGGAAVHSRAYGARSMIAGLNIRRRDRDRMERPAWRLLHRLEPYFSHAVAVNEMTANLLARAIVGEPPPEVESQPNQGIVIATDHQMLCWADAGAVALFGGMLRLMPTGRLAFFDPDVQHWFETVAASVHADPPPHRLVTAVRYGGRVWSIRALPCDGEVPASIAFPGLYLATRTPGRALALVIQAQAAHRDPETLLRRRFGLSAAEVSIALAIAEGLGTDQIAATRDASRNTVRNQIQSVLFKMGARNRGDVIRIVAEFQGRT